MGAGDELAGGRAVPGQQGVPGPADLRQQHEAARRAGQVVEDLARWPDLHLRAAGRREVARRQALHRGRRRVQHRQDAARRACAHACRAQQLHGLGQGHRPAVAGDQAEVAVPAVHLDVRGGHDADDAQAPVRRHRLRDQPGEPEAGGHRPVRVQGMEAGRLRQDGSQPRLLEEGPALSGRPGLLRDPRHRLARRGLREGGGADRQGRRPGSLGPEAFAEDRRRWTTPPRAGSCSRRNTTCS